MAEYFQEALNGGVSDQEHLAPSLPEPVNSQTESSAPVLDLDSLEAQGFTHAEAIRLVHTSELLAESREARESRELMRRLRFQRWLLERGLLDEFSA